MIIFSQLIANGLIAGSIYALVALGYTMVYGILGFINFAHGEVLMVGAYLAYALVAFAGVPIYAAMLISMALCATLGVVIERVAYRPLRNAPRLSPLITSIAVSLFLQATILLTFGADVRTFSTGADEGYHILGAIITPHQLLLIAVTLALMLGLYLFVTRTKLGTAMRAATDNRNLALMIGINIDMVIAIVFAAGSALAAAGGVLIGFEQNLTPTMGVVLGIKAFTAAVVGGIGNIYGAVLGGFAIGLIENIGAWFIPSGYKDAIAFFILLLMLLFKPAGLLGRNGRT